VKEALASSSIGAMTRSAILALFVAAACGSSSSAPAPGAPAPAAPAPAPAAGTPRYDARTFHATVIMAGVSFSHDGQRILISSNQSGVFNVYSVPVEGGAPRALTQSAKDANVAESYFPGDDRFLYSVDSGGNELTHLHVMEADGKSRDLTPGDKVKASFVGWSKDKKAFYVITNERDPRAFDLYRYAVDGYDRELVFKNEGAFAIGDVSGDQRWLAVGKTNTNADSDILLVDLRRKGKGKPKLVTKHKPPAQHEVLGFTPDSRRLYYGTDLHGEFVQAWSHDLGSGRQTEEVTASWDVSAVYFSENGRYRVTATNDDARTVLRIEDTQQKSVVTPVDLPPGDLTSAVFDRDEKQMAFYLSSDRTPRDLYVLDLASGKTRRLSSNLNPAVDAEHLVDAESVRYKSFDGLEIPALLYKPRDASPDARVPAIVWVHGGPGGQSRHGYIPLLQFAVNHGYAILAVNNRGSSGYGKTFHHLDDKRHGDVDLKDCVHGRRYLESLDWVDGKRVAIMGGSYGGYMVAAALAFEPDAFDAGVDIFGVTNWVRTLESVPPWWASFRDSLYAELGDPAAEKDRLTAISPLFHAQRIKKPLLVVQGANDPRVLKVESDEIVAAVKKNNVPVDYLVFPDEGHGFRKKDNEIAASERVIQFLDQHMPRR
jgi:dipeptidyl aminopeptidase/acylaminoacyl peptidase